MRPITKPTLAAVMMALTACSGSGGDGGINAPPPPTGDGKTVNATSSLTFTPATLTVTAGDVVTFAFGGVAHNVFFDRTAAAPADIPGAVANSSIQRTFATPGTYAYTCHIHPSMHGTVVVQ